MLQSAARGVAKAGAASSGGAVAVAAAQAAEPTFVSYVITVPFQPERWECMSRQLVSAPGQVHKQEALDFASDCPGLKLSPGIWTLDGGRNMTAVSSNFCTNFHLWQAGLQSDADWVMIFEDDAVLAPSFWEEVKGLVTGCPDFDYIVVDTVEGDGNMQYPDEERSDTCRSAGAWKLYRPRGIYQYKDVTVQIIRRQYLAKMIALAEEHGWMTMDAWMSKYLLLAGERAYSWQAGIALQSSQAAADHLPIPPGCPKHTESTLALN